MENNLVHIIYPHDPSTKFLTRIIDDLVKKHGTGFFNFIEVLASEDSYQKAKESIQNIPDESIVLFMGHGQENRLYGAENDEFNKKALISLTEMKILKGKYFFALACKSSDLLRASINQSGIINAVGFGSLPTEMEEVNNNKRLREQGIDQSVINEYRDIICELTFQAICDIIEKKCSFIEMTNYFELRLNKKISQVVLRDKKTQSNRILANFLFQMKTEMIFI